MKREERNTLNALRRSINPGTINVEVPTTYTHEGRQEIHHMLTLEKGFVAVRIYWNDIKQCTAVHYIPAGTVYADTRREQEITDIDTITASLPDCSGWTWNGYRRPGTEEPTEDTTNTTTTNEKEDETMTTTNTTIKTADIKRYTLGSCIDYLSDYDHGYICDIMSEIADNNTSIYYNDIIKFISENVEAVNDAIAEFGWEGCGSDLYKAGQMAEYEQINNAMYHDLEKGLYNFAISYLEHDAKVEEITEEQHEAIKDLCAETDHNDLLEDFTERLNEIINAED